MYTISLWVYVRESRVTWPRNASRDSFAIKSIVPKWVKCGKSLRERLDRNAVAARDKVLMNRVGIGRV